MASEPNASQQPQPQAQTPVQTPVHTPTQGYATTQWATTQMPIDPALQQQQQSQHQHQHQHPTPYQHYQAYTSHYPQTTYAHYQAYTPQPVQQQPQSQQQQQHPQQQQQQAQVATAPRPIVAQPAIQTQTQQVQQSSTGMDTSDIATLNDALGSAGVDLRAEEESLQRTHEQYQHTIYRNQEDRTRKQPQNPTFDTRILGTTMRTAAAQHKVTRVPEEAVNYLALALRARLQDLVENMVAAAHHRNDTQFDRPASLYDDGTAMWSIRVRSDVAKQLAVLEKVEREEEMRIRRERKERTDMAAAHAATLAAQAGGAGGGGGMPGADVFDESEGGAKKKRKKEMGPGVTAKNMSEDVRKKMSNAVATQAAGLGGKYAWMTSASTAAPAKPKAATAGSPATTTTSAAGAGSSGWARPYVPKKAPSVTPQPTVKEEEIDTRISVTMRDAMFVVEKERGHGGGRGAARGWV
ncbi:transcription initiation factor TFIID component TAF4 family-domain-containing protein [Crucibulum laeve]|uniref:Transcription initiation factor TFIID subunit 4 n=1 Tax=Crucibulum laeve TaxID=68775 RepID=A0A5C3MJ93_9AGAR|nr:transcription initiation factor TFIID component TAF4 family-domain-containing protein [Crucibulum laeve]